LKVDDNIFQDILLLTRLNPRFWWGEYALFSLLIPFLLVVYIFDSGHDLWNVISVFIPIFILYGFTFTLNYLTDVREDRYKENVFRMNRRRRILGFILLPLLLTAMIFLSYLYLSGTALIIFGVLLLVSIIYSWGLRLKETPMGPFAASLFYWGPAILLISHFSKDPWVNIGELKTESLIFLMYILSIFFYGLVMELEHNLFDLKADLKADVRTLAVRIGKERVGKLIKIVRIILAVPLIAFSFLISWHFALAVALMILVNLKWNVSLKYFFILLAVFFLVQEGLSQTAVFIFLCLSPHISFILVGMIQESRKLLHQIRRSRRHLIDRMHEEHKRIIFSELERM